MHLLNIAKDFRKIPKVVFERKTYWAKTRNNFVNVTLNKIQKYVKYTLYETVNYSLAILSKYKYSILIKSNYYSLIFCFSILIHL